MSQDEPSSSHHRPTIARAPSFNSVENGGPSEPLTDHSPTTAKFPAGASLASAPAGSASNMGGLSFESVGRAIGSRVMRGVKRGNLPFLIVFLSALVIFFSALAGIGYVDPDDASLASPVDTLTPEAVEAAAVAAAEFQPGAPVFDPSEDQVELARRKKIEEQRELERQWQRKKRPKDGAWMQKQRDDKAVRRVPGKVAEETEATHEKRDMRFLEREANPDAAVQAEKLD
ncbi:hypothetical protein BCR39DRAFT_540631 [Naematelia encephala]|uniref:Transmembrane protein n=1 Tax=Naematelia encephala TaxID=71784 RepID=A0A1Y2AWA5_9TREE|nr:hypothetical protein BCR39DRAFT_540631 [Naematelia encephala]